MPSVKSPLQLPICLCRAAASIDEAAAASRETPITFFTQHRTCYNNVALPILSMDEPSVQLQLDLNRSIRHELSTRRPLLHRLQGSSWVLQIPRPTNAVAHGARFYYNVLVNPCFVRQQSPSNGWFSQPPPASSHLQTTTALEELLRDLEILSNDLRPESRRKSNATVENGTGKLETLVDAVVVTSPDKSSEDSFLQLHSDVPVFAPQEAVQHIAALQHFRTVGAINEFGSDGCRDWRSTTALAGLPEWVGLSTLPEGDDATDRPDTLMIAFNNYHNNSSARLVKLQALMGSRQKRHAPTLPIEDEDFAEAVLFTSLEKLYDGMIPASHADPTIYPLAVVHNGPTPVRDLSAHETVSTRRELTAPHHICERNLVIEKGRGFLAWLIAKATFQKQETSRPQSPVDKRDSQSMEDDIPLSLQKISLSVGESKVLI